MSGILDSRQILAFATLAKTGSFTQVAREMFLTQSAISHAIKALESDLECRLFDRVNKKVILTPAGEQLLHHVSKILNEMGSARAGMARLKRWGQTRVRLAAPATICTHLLPGILREFKQQFPHCLLSVESSDASESLNLLDAGRADLAIAVQSKSDDRFEFAPLFSDELVFIVSPSHPWAKSGRVARDDIPNQQVILYGRTSFTGRLVDNYFKEDGITLQSVLELRSMSGIKEMVKLDLGIGIVAPWVARFELSKGSLVALPLGRRKLRRSWGVLSRRDRRFSLPESTLIRLSHKAMAAEFGAQESNS